MITARLRSTELPISQQEQDFGIQGHNLRNAKSDVRLIGISRETFLRLNKSLPATHDVWLEDYINIYDKKLELN